MNQCSSFHSNSPVRKGVFQMMEESVGHSERPRGPNQLFAAFDLVSRDVLDWRPTSSEWLLGGWVILLRGATVWVPAGGVGLSLEQTPVGRCCRARCEAG
jgi:hypothetical protein